MAATATLVVGILAAGYSAYSAHETEQDQKAALNEQENIAQDQLATKKKQMIAQQRASFLASGISLTSETAKVFEADTITASETESNRISNYYDTQLSNASSAARSQYISAIGSAASSIGDYYNTTTVNSGVSDLSSRVDSLSSKVSDLSKTEDAE